MTKKSTNRIIALIFSSLLIFGTSPLAKEAPPKQNAIQGISNNICGFKLEKKLNYKDTTVYYFVHEKSGAHAIVEKNSDKEKSFQIGFRTPAENDKGINHIIEHSVLNGSKNYPYKNMIFELLNLSKTSTLLNAFTSSTYTAYPVSNFSENELESLAKIYTDGIFNPAFLTNEKIFKKEGIRYELDEKGNLTANGTVFNEMNNGNANLSPKTLKRLFPDTPSKNYFGGIPDQIMDLKYEEVCETYKKNYHPSNCLIYLHGNINYERFFKWLDKDYLSKYDSKDMSYIKYKDQDPDNLSSYEKIDVYSSDCTNSEIEIDYILPWDFYNDNYKNIENLVKTINTDPDIAKFIKEKGYESGYSLFTSFWYTPIIRFSFKALQENKKCFEKEYANNTLKEIFSMITSPKGLEKQEKNNKERKFGREKEKAFKQTTNKINFGNFMESFIRFNSPISNKFFNIKNNNIYFKSSNKTIKNLIDDISNLKPITTFLNYSSDTSLSVAKKIKNKCKSLENEKEKLTQNYKEQQAWANAPNDASEIKNLKSMFNNYSDVDTKPDIPDFEKTKIEDKNHYYCAEEKLGDFFQLKYVFKINYLDKEDKKYLPFLNKYFQLLRKENLDHLSDIGFYTENVPIKNDDNHENRYETLSVITNKENLPKVTEELNKIFSFKYPLDKDSTKNLAQDFINNYKSPFDRKMLKFSAIANDSLSPEEAEKALENQYNFCDEIVKNINDDAYAKDFSKKLNNLFNKIHNINSLQSTGSLSSAKNKEMCKNTISLFMDNLSKNTVSDNSPREFKKLNKSIAVVDKMFTNNYIFGNIYFPEICKNERFKCLTNSITNSFLIPNIREKGGAYGAGIHTINNKYIEMLSYRDPHVDSTIEFFSKVPQFLKDHNFTKEDIENMYVKKLMDTCSREKLSFINEKMRGLMLFGDDYPDYQKLMEEKLESIKTMTTEDIKAFGETLKKYIPEMKIIALTSSLKNIKTKFDIVIS